MIGEVLSRTDLAILLVEDDPLESEHLLQLLDRFEVGREVRLDDALTALTERDFDIILVDRSLPGESDNEIVTRLHAENPDVPILILSAFEDGEAAARLFALGAQDFLIKKELTEESLLRAITHAYERQILVTELRETRLRAEQLAQEKAQFASMVSHEILNPMTGLLGFTKLLMRTELTSSQRDYVETILECGTSLAELVSELLSLSRLRDGVDQAKEENFSLRSLVGELGAFLSPNIKPEVRLLTLVDPRLPEQLLGDRLKLRQIIYNLAQNALKFTEQGHVVIQARCLANDGERVKIRLLIEDTGRGIPLDKRSSIFEAFSQNQASDRGKGHGLGLALCSALADALKTRIQVESAPGRGTVFWMDLCLTQVQPAQDWTSRLEGRSVLFSESYLPARQLVGEMLQQMGAAVDFWPGEQPFLAYDLLLLDRKSHGTINSHMLGPRANRTFLVARPDDVRESDSRRVSNSYHLSDLMEHLQSDQQETEPVPASSEALVDRMRALVVDDDRVCRECLRLMLEPLGFECTLVEGGEEALRAITRGSFELVTIDNDLGSWLGPDLYREIHKRGLNKPGTVYFAITGSPQEWRNKVRASEPSLHILSKPVCADELAELILDLEWRDSEPEPETRPTTSLDLVGETGRRVLMETFQESLPELMLDIERAIQGSEPDLVRRGAHQLHGSASVVGAHRLARLARELEEHASEPHLWEGILHKLNSNLEMEVA